MQETDGLKYPGPSEGQADTESRVTVADLRDRTIEEYMWLVRCIAKSMADNLPEQVDVDDLISAGMVGLIKAVDDFDPARGAKLETYARYRIKGAILDELRKQDMLPYSTRSKLRGLDKAIHNLERTLGRYPSDREIANEAGITEDELSRLLSLATAIDLYSLDDILESGKVDVDMAAGQARAQQEDPLTRLEREEIARVMVEGLKELPRMERVVLGLYYYEGLRMKEIGEVLGVTESRISQIHSRAILLLRAKLRIHLRG